MKKVQKDAKTLLFENMVKLNSDFKLNEGLGNFHASFAERTGQIFKDANDSWTNGAFHVRYRMLVNLGIEDSLAQKYADEFEGKTWDEVKTALGKTGIGETYGVPDPLGTNMAEPVNEKDDKWIQKAVDPEHKGYCTPMSKPTCTPRRKALAKRFKKGIEDESLNIDAFGENSPEFKEIAEKIKSVIDDLYMDGDYDILQTLYKLIVDRKYHPSNVNEDNTQDPQKQAELLKGKIDFLRDNNHFDILNQLDDIISRLFPDEPEAEISEDLGFGSMPKFATSQKLIRSAERDGYLKGMESSATYVMDAAREIGDEWDKLHPEQQKVFRDSFYNKFLKKIGKI
jgi:hypothetical protein